MLCAEDLRYMHRTYLHICVFEGWREESGKRGGGAGAVREGKGRGRERERERERIQEKPGKINFIRENG